MMMRCLLALSVVLTQTGPSASQVLKFPATLADALLTADGIAKMFVKPDNLRVIIDPAKLKKEIPPGACGIMSALQAQLTSVLLASDTSSMAEVYTEARAEVRSIAAAAETVAEKYCGVVPDDSIKPGVHTNQMVADLVDIRNRLRKVQAPGYLPEDTGRPDLAPWTMYTSRSLKDLRTHLATTSPERDRIDRAPLLKACYRMGRVYVGASKIKAALQSDPDGSGVQILGRCTNLGDQLLMSTEEAGAAVCMSVGEQTAIPVGQLSDQFTQQTALIEAQLNVIKSSCIKR